MATEATAKPEMRPPPKDDPFFFGWRYVSSRDQNGNETYEQVPLTEWDVLHPREGDFIVHSLAHIRDCNYLAGALGDIVRALPKMKLFQDLRIDWQLDDESVLGHD